MTASYWLIQSNKHFKTHLHGVKVEFACTCYMFCSQSSFIYHCCSSSQHLVIINKLIKINIRLFSAPPFFVEAPLCKQIDSSPLRGGQERSIIEFNSTSGNNNKQNQFPTGKHRAFTGPFAALQSPRNGSTCSVDLQGQNPYASFLPVQSKTT